MSQENVEIVRAAIDAFNRGDGGELGTRPDGRQDPRSAAGTWPRAPTRTVQHEPGTRDTARAMLQESVEVRNEVVRRWFRSFEDDAAGFRDTLHPDLVWFPFEENLTPAHGIEGAMRNRNQWLEIWEEHRFDLEEVVEDGDNVVVLVHITARGRASGINVDFRFYAHFTVKGDKVIRIYDHEQRAAALEAAGLAE
jgi:ketosteroid isomerase-like protein